MFSTYVLGVKSNFRGENLINELIRYNISPNVVWGPDVLEDDSTIKVHTNQEFANFTIGRDIKPQEVACCIGHIRMYEEFFENGDEWGLFFEDDAILELDPTPIFESLPTTDIEIQIFIHDGPGTNLRYRKNLITTGNVFLRRLDPQYGAYGYILNRAAVSSILNSQIRLLINTPDWPYFWPKEIHFYVSSQVYVSHPEDMSMSIIGERINKKSTLKNQLPKWSRLMKGLKYASDFNIIFHREITVKVLRIFLQIRKRILK